MSAASSELAGLLSGSKRCVNVSAELIIIEGMSPCNNINFFAVVETVMLQLARMLLTQYWRQISLLITYATKYQNEFFAKYIFSLRMQL